MSLPEFVRQGILFAAPESSRETELDRIRYESIMSFVATWEALNFTGDDEIIRSRREVESIGTYGRYYFQTAYLRLLANMDI